jgi:hypothetical protein
MLVCFPALEFTRRVSDGCGENKLVKIVVCKPAPWFAEKAINSLKDVHSTMIDSGSLEETVLVAECCVGRTYITRIRARGPSHSSWLKPMFSHLAYHLW